jgi:hypothetical protein
MKYSTQASTLLSSIKSDIINRLPYNKEINNRQCNVQVLNDDHSTIWVKWGPYDCELKDLPSTALGTIADHIVEGY